MNKAQKRPTSSGLCELAQGVNDETLFNIYRDFVEYAARELKKAGVGSPIIVSGIPKKFSRYDYRDAIKQLMKIRTGLETVERFIQGHDKFEESRGFYPVIKLIQDSRAPLSDLVTSLTLALDLDETFPTMKPTHLGTFHDIAFATLDILECSANRPRLTKRLFKYLKMNGELESILRKLGVWPALSMPRVNKEIPSSGSWKSGFHKQLRISVAAQMNALTARKNRSSNLVDKLLKDRRRPLLKVIEAHSKSWIYPGSPTPKYSRLARLRRLGA